MNTQRTFERPRRHGWFLLLGMLALGLVFGPLTREHRVLLAAEEGINPAAPLALVTGHYETAPLETAALR